MGFDAAGWLLRISLWEDPRASSAPAPEELYSAYLESCPEERERMPKRAGTKVQDPGSFMSS